jgi:hypothetical protein
MSTIFFLFYWILFTKIDQYLSPDYQWTAFYDSIPTPQWCPDHPKTDSSLKCLVFTNAGCMKDVNCSNQYGVVCERFLDHSGNVAPNSNSFIMNSNSFSKNG